LAEMRDAHSKHRHYALDLFMGEAP
jgi:hypothetical protein